jgi:hypothetical protein
LFLSEIALDCGGYAIPYQYGVDIITREDLQHRFERRADKIDIAQEQEELLGHRGLQAAEDMGDAQGLFLVTYTILTPIAFAVADHTHNREAFIATMIGIHKTALAIS